MMAGQPLRKASDDELSAAIQENLFALFRAMASLPGGVLEERDNNSYHYSYPMTLFFKGVWGTNLLAEVVDSELDKALAWFRKRNAPLIFWWMGQETSTPDLGARRDARGFLSMETVPEGLEIEPVRNEASLYEFKQVLVEGYEASESLAHAWVKSTLSFGFERSPNHSDRRHGPEKDAPDGCAVWRRLQLLRRRRGRGDGGRLEVLKGHCETLGRPYEEIEKTVLFDRGNLAEQSPAQIVDRSKELESMGFEHIIYTFNSDYTLDTVGTIVTDIIPQIG